MPSSARLSYNTIIVISFLSGVIFYNGVAAVLNGQLEFSLFSFAAAVVSLVVLKMMRWEESV